jgi:sigma-B regulation protein RsbU (phosphoserine phosphatase)
MRILIADDDRSSNLMLERTLVQWGFEVIVVADGAAAWKQIAGAAPPELAIIDWEMPRVDGIELCRRIRAASLDAPMYVILLTARSSRQDLVAGLEAGADDYLTKPFDPDELRARIHVGQRTLGLITDLKQLTNLLPICCYCKRIRSDDNYWHQVDGYISEHTDALFSHRICPPCMVRSMRETEGGLTG